MQKLVLHNQSLLDLVLNHCGCLDSLLVIAILNGLSITDDLVPGQIVTIPSDSIVDTVIRDYYYLNNITPAFAIQIQNNISTDYVFPYTFPLSF